MRKMTSAQIISLNGTPRDGMTRSDAMKLLEGKTGKGKWLYKKLNGEFAILECLHDPKHLKEAIYLFSDVQIEAAIDWLCEMPYLAYEG